MDNLLFLYNLLLTIILTIAITGFCVLYMKNKQSHYIYIALLYVLLIMDNSIIYILEFSENLYQFYESSFILYSMIDLIYLGIIILLRLTISKMTMIPLSKKEKILFIVTPILVGLIAHVSSETIGEEVIFIAFCMALIYLSTVLKRTFKDSTSLLSNTKLVTFIAFAGIVESLFYYYQSNYSNAAVGFGFLYRYIIFDLLKLLICIIGLRYLIRSINQLFEHKSDDDKLGAFCNQYNLTARQKEIIALVIEGHSNKEIGQRLNITEGTVKTHIYNIFKKSEITSRNQLMQLVNKQ